MSRGGWSFSRLGWSGPKAALSPPGQQEAGGCRRFQVRPGALEASAPGCPQGPLCGEVAVTPNPAPNCSAPQTRERGLCPGSHAAPLPSSHADPVGLLSALPGLQARHSTSLIPPALPSDQNSLPPRRSHAHRHLPARPCPTGLILLLPTSQLEPSCRKYGAPPANSHRTPPFPAGALSICSLLFGPMIFCRVDMHPGAVSCFHNTPLTSSVDTQGIVSDGWGCSILGTPRGPRRGANLTVQQKEGLSGRASWRR